MHPQLRAIVGDLESAGERLHTLRAALACDAWSRRPAEDRWSAAECVAHLNLTSRTLLPLLRAGLRDAGTCALPPRARYRRDPMGWLIWAALAPSSGVKTRAIPECVPCEAQSVDTVFDDFRQLQSEMIACVRDANGLPIDRVMLASPFDGRLRYNLYAAMTLVPRHQHRHLLQAERAARACAPLGSPLTA